MPTPSHLKIPIKMVQLVAIAALLLPVQLHAAGSSNESAKPSTAQQLKKIERLIYKEKYSSAIKKLKRTIKSNKKSADAWNLLGYASRKSGDTTAAENAYNKALSLDKNHLGALEYQGELYITLGRYDDARGNLDRLNTLCPSGCEEQKELADALAAIN